MERYTYKSVCLFVFNLNSSGVLCDSTHTRSAARFSIVYVATMVLYRSYTKICCHNGTIRVVYQDGGSRQN